MFINSENWEDGKKYFQNTWVKFKEEGDTLFFVERVTPDHMDVSTISKEDCRVLIHKGYTIDYLIPRKTIFQHDINAVMLRRTPARMWKKGMCNSNTTFSKLLSNNWYAVDFDINLAEGFVNKPVYYSLDAALTQFTINPEMQSVALTPRIALTRDGNVFIDEILVGKYNFDKKVLTSRSIYKDNLVKAFPSTTFKALS